MQKAYIFKVTGRVQGVCFRAETKRVADALGIAGWVQNCSDGSMEVLAQGEEEALKKLEKWCAHGPSAARVTDVERKEMHLENMINFLVRYESDE